VLHGYLRATVDLDLVIQLEPQNVRRAIHVFKQLGFEPRVPVPIESFEDEGERARWVREKNATVFSLWHPEEPGFLVDLFIEEPFDFAARYQRAAVVRLDDQEVRVLSIDDLVEMKRAAGRPQDLVVRQPSIDGSWRSFTLLASLLLLDVDPATPASERLASDAKSSPDTLSNEGRRTTSRRGSPARARANPRRGDAVTRSSSKKDEQPAAAGWTFDDARVAAVREGLRLTPSERLAWLEETVAELESLVGRARSREGRPDRTGTSSAGTTTSIATPDSAS